MREKWFTITVIGAVFISLFVHLVVFSVRVDQVAVHRRFAKVVRVIRPPLGVGSQSREASASAMRAEGVKVVEKAGWFFQLPWPFDKVESYDQRIRVIDGPLAQTQLPDRNQIIPRVYATWRIANPVAFEKSLEGDEKSAEVNLKQIISDQTSKVLGTCTLDDLVNTDPAELKFDQIEDEVLAGVRQRLASSQDAYGLEVCSLGITWIALPVETTGAVFGRMRKESETKAQAIRNEGETIKQTMIAQARAERQKIIAEAEATAKATRSKAEAEAAVFYETFAKDEEFHVFLRRLEAFQNIARTAAANGQPLTILMSTKAEPFSILDHGPAARASGDQAPQGPEPPVPVLAPREAPAAASGE
ncbi:MAG: hypothetical protein KAX44_05420 [Candidatus Brocadiae bacterium]|nr:hypothetical protein [Candidatus Brocadiia bacterium]